MLLTISTTQAPATDLGYLLHKNPARLHTFSLSFGQAHVFYPHASPERCTAALLLDVDPMALVRGRQGMPGDSFALGQYVNERPYVASSFLSVAIAQMYGSALAGRSKERQALAETELPLEATLAVVPCRGGEALLRRLWEPLGYAVSAHRHTLDEHFPNWGQSPYFTVELQCRKRLSELLSHIYVLVPVLDDAKHYWVGEAEVDKLLQRGAGWLPSHPERELIVKRYLRYRQRLTREALARLVDEDMPDPDASEVVHDHEEATIEDRISLHQQRLQTVVTMLKELGAKRVLDLGCGEGRLLQALLREPEFEEIVGMDVSYRALQQAQQRLQLDRLPSRQRERIKLVQGSLIYRDRRLAGYDAAAVVEVIEHLDPARLAAFERVVFEAARPTAVIITTPNHEYNVKWETLPAGSLRHKDHRFEWTRAEFQAWAQEVARRWSYNVYFLPVGPEDAGVGAPTQMGVFRRS